jgi:hypothetical protein
MGSEPVQMVLGVSERISELNGFCRICRIIREFSNFFFYRIWCKLKKNSKIITIQIRIIPELYPNYSRITNFWPRRTFPEPIICYYGYN